MYLIKIKKGILFSSAEIMYKDWSDDMETYLIKEIKSKNRIPFFKLKKWIRQEMFNILIDNRKLEVTHG